MAPIDPFEQTEANDSDHPRAQVSPTDETLLHDSPPSILDPTEIADPTKIGRYVILERLGEGGMGIVLAAYDPKLDRKVAIKLIHAQRQDDVERRLRMEREAQAMARLAHPNVVTVYEVGEYSGQLFLAMEFIKGQNLSAWLHTPPSPKGRDILAMFIQAGHGLAAAHMAGLVHRDFKPDNVFVGEDGRVRVGDFGLARQGATTKDETTTMRAGTKRQLDTSDLTVTGAMMGTPAYMAPEQFAGETTDSRTDQFAFCAALWEALYGQRPFIGHSLAELILNVTMGRRTPPPTGKRVPTWLRRVLERGLSHEPDLRYPTTQALLAALSRDPGRTVRRWMAIGAVVVVASASYGAAAYRTAEAQLCSGSEEELRGTWDPERRAAVEQAMRGTGVAYAERSLQVVEQHLDKYAATWVQLHQSSCTAHQRGHMSSQLFDRRMACLRLRRSELASTAAVLAQTTRDTVAEVVDAARGLPPATLCEDDARLLAAVAPPENPETAAAVEAGRGKLAKLQALERSGRYNDALIEIPAQIDEATRLAYLPYQAEVQLLAGKLQMQKVEQAQAQQHLALALHLGIEARLDDLAAEALSYTIFVLATAERRTDEALALEPLAWALARRAGSPPLLAANLHNVIGVTYHERADGPRSIQEYAQALKLLETFAPEDPLRWATVSNLAVALGNVGQHTRAGELARTALAQLEHQYDVCHPHVASLQVAVAASDAALSATERSVAGYERALTCFVIDYPEYALITLSELGNLHLLVGDEAKARAALARADDLLLRFPDSRPRAPEIELLRTDLAIHIGEAESARSLLVALRDQSPPAAASDMVLRVDTRLALLAHHEHDDARALDLLQSAEQMLAPDHNNAERGLYAFTLARTLQALGREPERVMVLVEEAIEAYETSGALYAGQVAEIRAWQKLIRL